VISTVVVGFVLFEVTCFYFMVTIIVDGQNDII